MKIGSRFSHYFFAISVILVSGGVLGQVVLNSHAQDLTANVGNSAPIIVGGSEKLCDNSGSIANTDGAISACSNLAAVTLSAGTTTDLSFFARARDNNGNSDISSGPFTGAFYHDANSDTGNAGCTDDDNDCYQLSCSKVVDIPGGGDTDAWIRCDFSMQYFADDSVGAAEWLGYVEIYDQALVGANNGSGYATEVSKLISATFPVVNFGNRQLGAETDAGSNVEIQHQNNGNVLIDFEVSADDDDTNAALDCTTTGNLSVSNIKFDTSDVDYSTSLFTLPAEPTTVELNIDIQQRTNDSTTVIDDATGDIQRTYWNVSVPATGLEGFCEEELNVTVFEGP